MEFDDIRVFVAIVDAGSFTLAADQLKMSKQYVSRRTVALEAALGVRLLHRNTRKLAVTESGREFYSRAQRILTEVEDAELAMSIRRTELHGSLRISVPLSVGITYLSPLVSAFLSIHPGVRIQIDFSDRRVDPIGEGFDLMLRLGALEDSTLVARNLGHSRMIACCSPTYIRERGTPSTPLDLHDHVCLLDGQEWRGNWKFEIDGVCQTIVVHGPLVANHGEVVRDAAVAGLGVALLPDFVVMPAIESGLLVPVLETFAPPPIGLSAIFPRHREAFVTLRTFINFIADRLIQDVTVPIHLTKS
ncbi:LysR substrate-binding domain-containing protein [Burkholderia sp. PU8-34]